MHDSNTLYMHKSLLLTCVLGIKIDHFFNILMKYQSTSSLSVLRMECTAHNMHLKSHAICFYSRPCFLFHRGWGLEEHLARVVTQRAETDMLVSSARISPFGILAPSPCKLADLHSEAET